METPSEKYIREHSTGQTEALRWIQQQSNIRTNYPRMISGEMQGQFLKMIVQMLNPKHILEIGTFTGYSSTCMAMGLSEGSYIDTLEINDELVDLMREGWSRAGVTEKITLHIGDARQTLSQMEDCTFDLVFMDANKREYCEYYDLFFDLVRPGGFILADDVLWSGKIFEEPMPQDKQTVGIASFNDKVAADPRVESVILPIREGINLIRKK